MKIQLDFNDKPAVSLFLEMHRCASAKRWLAVILPDVRFASENLATTVIRNLNAPQMSLEIAKLQNFVQICNCATRNSKLYTVVCIGS